MFSTASVFVDSVSFCFVSSLFVSFSSQLFSFFDDGASASEVSRLRLPEGELRSVLSFSLDFCNYIIIMLINDNQRLIF